MTPLDNIISVVVCTYNQEATIGRTLESILRQRCSWPVEIVIGEDCSTDATPVICREYAARYPDRIRLFCNTTNKGLLDNYYDCLLQARGKYIADLAGDDEWCDPCKLERQLRLLEVHPEVVLVHTDYRLRSEASGRFLTAPFYAYPKGITEGQSLTISILTQTRRPVVHLCTAMYRTDAFRRCYEQHTDLFRNRLYPCEDLQLCALLSHEGYFAYLDTITLNYSVAPSVSRTDDDARQFDFVARATQLSFDLQQQLLPQGNDLLRRFYTYRVYALLMHACRSHRPDLRNEAKKFACQWQTKNDWRTSAVLFFTSNEMLWHLSLWMRKKLLQLRRH